jgi:hypothetical protein
MSEQGIDDIEAFRLALREYQQSSYDVRDFADLPADVQSAIIHRAQLVKTRREQEKRS